jgi:SM-20-related protein
MLRFGIMKQNLFCEPRTEMTKANTNFDLLLVAGFLDPEICRELSAEMRCSPTSPAVTYGQGSYGLVNERVRKVERLEPSRETVEYVARRLSEYREEVGEHFSISLNGCEEPQFLRYRVGDFFVAHQDGNTGLVHLDTDRLRRISISIFLNRQSDAPEPDTYCGGSLVFSDWRAGREFRLEGETGTLVGFRSETTHEVIPVTHGERYAIVSWYEA